ncbi:hypothetical protein RRG08_056821 [Elysia crispata]|uniref:Uncharacterized protein n=1 Tax=Elysia crispata TaxID=231223 RepID=A0AAE1ACS0_9GAST|nr:hypothetical protein RRG08_056821 [Elysia crispata]
MLRGTREPVNAECNEENLEFRTRSAPGPANYVPNTSSPHRRPKHQIRGRNADEINEKSVRHGGKIRCSEDSPH